MVGKRLLKCSSILFFEPKRVVNGFLVNLLLSGVSTLDFLFGVSKLAAKRGVCRVEWSEIDDRKLFKKS